MTPKEYLETQKLIVIDPLNGYKITYSQLERMLEEYNQQEIPTDNEIINLLNHHIGVAILESNIGIDVKSSAFENLRNSIINSLMYHGKYIFSNQSERKQELDNNRSGYVEGVYGYKTSINNMKFEIPSHPTIEKKQVEEFIKLIDRVYDDIDYSGNLSSETLIRIRDTRKKYIEHQLSKENKVKEIECTCRGFAKSDACHKLGCRIDRIKDQEPDQEICVKEGCNNIAQTNYKVCAKCYKEFVDNGGFDESNK